MLQRFIFLCVLGILSSCKMGPKPQESLCLEPKTFDQISGWKDDDLRPAFIAFKKSCQAFKKQERGKRMGLSMSVGIWHDICDRADKISHQDPKEVHQFFEENFTPYRAYDHDKNDTGLYTGYYESSLKGSLKPSPKYPHPLYKKPKDLIRKGNQYGKKGLFSFGPHHDRRTINDGALDGKELELLWVDCPIDAFFLHIQGSGRIQLADGRYIKVGYDGANGHPYTPIGRILIDQGHAQKEEMSMQFIRDWIKKNPGKGEELMNQNASYVFFKILEDVGAIGAQGVPVQTGRSLAVDKRFIPYGVPVWLDATDQENTVSLQRLLIAQDTGGAIKGPLRGDVFWGFGEMAAKIAGQMKSKGRSYLLLPNKIPFQGCYKG
jgi:membrane-bound lytic murein transglycosylase A